MTQPLHDILEGGPAYGVIDAKDGYLLFGREGHEAEFRAVVEQVQAAANDVEVIPLDTPDDVPDRVFIAPLSPGH
ncbi:MAG: hypothetical protein KJ676_14400 [Alphaproteobacteria bacterium]|nr:hypothetical protein [Alphaproteobacteria bacterium]MBU1526674.1 hypothetical protein [Alphaproteobacteria bacterium]MBU2118612.1 hypothetical protein [Alphaproteobacteria bacterium]MBU2350182.1 hypothetical protein [Alphaproteobacteria bacterium]MBU2382138.1 hypothetical protein [Alphaproteobacteria bacterium]